VRKNLVDWTIILKRFILAPFFGRFTPRSRSACENPPFAGLLEHQRSAGRHDAVRTNFFHVSKPQPMMFGLRIRDRILIDVKRFYVYGMLMEAGFVERNLQEDRTTIRGRRGKSR
jgi:hypothetical protein